MLPAADSDGPAEPPRPAPTLAVASRDERGAAAPARPDPLLEVRNLTKHYPIGGGFFKAPTATVRAVDGVDLSIHPGETLGLVGESGCGKTTLGRCIARLLEPTSGQVVYRRADDRLVDLVPLRGRALVMYLGKVAGQADTAELYRRPHHPYTETLLDAVPLLDLTRRRVERARATADDLPDPANPPAGCLFHTRCPHVREELCRTDVPQLRATGKHHRAACHYADQLLLSGISSPG